MNHPPIPPKSAQFVTLDGDIFFQWPRRPDGTSSTLLHCTAHPPMADLITCKDRRLIIAAVAEVEWRKRAERWALVCEWLISKGHEHQFHGYGFTKPGSKLLAECINRVSDCKSYAWQWRKWGEK